MTKLVLPIEVNSEPIIIDYDIKPTATRGAYAVSASVNMLPDSSMRRIATGVAFGPWQGINDDAYIVSECEGIQCIWRFGEIALDIILYVLGADSEESIRHSYAVDMYNEKRRMHYLVCNEIATSAKDEEIKVRCSLFLEKPTSLEDMSDSFKHLGRSFKGKVAFVFGYDEDN